MLSIATGYDPGYLTRQSAPRAANYYTIAVTQHGEPQGVWWGPGAEALGFTLGGEIGPEVMEKLYSSFLDPRDENFLKSDISDKEKEILGRRPPQYKDADSWYAQLLQREPEATPERQRELRSEAAQKAARQKTVFFYDATFSAPKSVSLLHAGLLSAAQTAEDAGNTERAAQCRERAEAVERAVMAASSASLEYLREHAGAARTGYHGGKVEGRSTGRWTPAGGFVASQFLQHTNRAGEPQMHVHGAILGRQLCEDGKWRGIDSRALFRSRAGASAAGDRKLMQDLTRDLGVEAVSRADGNGFELKGVSTNQILSFSSRRTSITDGMKHKVQDYVDAHGRLPNARVMYKMAQEVTLDTRKSKEPNLDRQALLVKWETLADRLELGKLAHLPRNVLGRISPERNDSLKYEPTQIEVDRIITTAVARVQQAKSVFTRHDVYRRINDELPANLGALSDEQTQALVDGMTDVALSPGGPAGVRLLNAPDVVLIPDELCDEQGRSMYLAPNAERYTTTELLDAEQELIFEALRLDAPRIQVEQPAETVEVSAQAQDVSAETTQSDEVAAAEAEAVGSKHQVELSETAGGPEPGETEGGETAVGSGEAEAESGEAISVWDEAPRSSEGNRPDSHENHEGSTDDPRVLDGLVTTSTPEPADQPPQVAETAVQAVERTPEQERLIQAHRDAATWFTQQLHGEQGQAARAYAHGRGFEHAMAENSPWQLGYGGSSRYALFDHLSKLGYSNDELIASGLVLRTEGGGIVDRFRERVVLPVHDAQGDPVAFMGRKMPESNLRAKWMNSPESSIYSKGDIVLGLAEQRQALAEGAQPVIVEGLFDILAVAGTQDERFVAVAPGGTAFTEQQYATLTNVTGNDADLLVAFDDDKGGRAAAVRAYDLLRHHAGPVHAASLPEGMDPGDLATDPERLRTVLADQERLLIDVALTACVDSYRRQESTYERPAELRTEASTWLDPEEAAQARARYVQSLNERERPGPDMGARLARHLAREGLGVYLPEPAPEVARPADQPAPEIPPYQAGDLTIEASIAAIEEAARLIDPHAPDGAEKARRVMARLVEETGADMDTVQKVFVDALIGPPLTMERDPMQPRDAWDTLKVLPGAISPETAAAWRETDRQRAAEQAAAEASERESAEREVETTGSSPEGVEGEAKRETSEIVSTHTPRVSEETARALRDSAKLRAELMERYPQLDVDQADAIAGMATSGRGVDVLVGPAGAGKSTTVGYLAHEWRQHTSSPVIGLATAQNAANILGTKRVEGQAAFTATHNIAKWLYLVESGKQRVEPGSLFVVDEASMVTTTHLREIQKIAAQAGAKVVWAGDHHQLTAPGAAGAMRHLSELGGAYHLTTAHRFVEGWEAKASLELRDGVAQALNAYDKHGRLTAGVRVDMEMEALRGYLADYMDNKQTLLLTSTNEAASALSARVREALVEAGQVEAAGVQLRDTNIAGTGDLIVARGNKRTIQLGDEVRALSNRDVLRVIDTTEEGMIRAALTVEGVVSETVAELPADYVAEQVELAYAGTTHAAQGRDVTTCHSIVDGTVTAEMLYVMITRAQEGNYAYGVVEDTSSDLRIGPEQAQEYTAGLLRQGRERGSAEQEAQRARAAVEADEQRLAVFAAALQRDGAEPMATEAMLGENERPRDLRHLGSMWLDMTRTYTARGYLEGAVARGLLTQDQLTKALGEDALGTLGQMLTRLDTAGYPAVSILDAAITERELGTAKEITQVLYWRIEGDGEKRGIDVHELDPSESQIHASWSERTRDLGVPTIDVSRHDIAERMDERTAELAERAAVRPPQWLVEHIGPVPAAQYTSQYQAWVERAGKVLAYREQWSYTSQSEPIGPAPSRANPEQRATWLSAHDALGAPEGQRDLSGASIGELYALRVDYERETRWAPAYVADELRAASRQTHQLQQQAAELRAAAEREEDPDRRTALEVQAQARVELAADLEAHRRDLVRVDEARQGWYESTDDKRMLAERADQELRRRADQDERQGRAPRVDVAGLLPLALDGAAGREYERAQERRADQQAAAETEQVHPGQLALDFATAEPEPEVVEAEPVEVEPEQLELDLEVEQVEPEPEVDERALDEADELPAAWEGAPQPVEFDRAGFVAFGALGGLTAAEVEPEMEVVEAEPVEAEEEPVEGSVPAREPVVEVIDVAVTREVVEHTAGEVEEVTVTEIDNSALPDAWQREQEGQPEREEERQIPEPEPQAQQEVEYEGPGVDQPTLWEETIDHQAEMDRIIDQARHAADLATHRNADRVAEQVAAEEADREMRQREAREIDIELADREVLARQELEQQEAQRQAEEQRQMADQQIEL